MFLISKIVRGRRLLNELEKEEKEHGKEIQYHKSKFQLTKELQRSGNESVKHVRKSSMQGRPPRVQRKSSCVGRLPCRFQAVTKATDIEINQYNPQQQEQQSKFIGATSEQTSKVVSGRERSESNAIHHSEASTSKLNSLTPNDRLKRYDTSSLKAKRV